MLGALMLRPFGLADLGWQLRLGESILQGHSAWVSDRFATLHLGEPVVPNAWLAQTIYWLIRESLGWLALRALDAVLWLGGLLIAAVPALRRNQPPLAILGACVVAFAVALPTASIRPQSFAAPMFALALLLGQARVPLMRTLGLALPLFVTWQNLHPSVAIAAVIFGAAAAVQAIHDRSIFSGETLRIAGIAACAAVATVLTPAGLHIFAFSAYNTTASLAVGATEWQPLWAAINMPFLFPVAVSAVLAAAIGWTARSQLAAIEWVAPLVCLALSLTAARFIFFYAIALLPLLAHVRIGSEIALLDRRRIVAICLPMAAILGAAGLVSLPLRMEVEAPQAAVAQLARQAPPGSVFCDPAFGGVLVDQGEGRWTVSFDGRFYAYSLDELAMLKSTWSRTVDLAAIDATYRPVAFLLARVRSPGLITRLSESPSQWRQVYADDVAVAFVRSESPNR